MIAFITLSQVGVLGGDPNISVYKGLMYFAACMPMAIAGLFSAIAQGKTSVASIAMVTKRPDQAGKAIIFPVMVETYAILALLISIPGITAWEAFKGRTCPWRPAARIPTPRRRMVYRLGELT